MAWYDWHHVPRDETVLPRGEQLRRTYNQLQQRRNPNTFWAMVGGLTLLAATGAAAIAPPTHIVGTPVSGSPETSPDAITPDLERGNQRPLEKPTTTKKSKKAPTIVQEAPPPKPSARQPLRAWSRPEVANNPGLHQTLERIDNVNLDKEKVARILGSINTQYYDQAQQNPKFNPAEMKKRGIAQNKTQFITKHYSVGYYGSPDRMDVPTYLDSITTSMGRDGDPVCCASNQVIDRNTIYWLAPFQAKLVHNRGYDSATTGAETVARDQPDVTTSQYELNMALDVGVMVREGWLNETNVASFSSITTCRQYIRGHAESRAAYNNQAHSANANPSQVNMKVWPAKADFNELVMDAYLQRTTEFIQDNPDFITALPQSFMHLP